MRIGEEMKKVIIAALLAVTLSISAEESKIIIDKTIDIDGYVKKDKVGDEELISLRGEVNAQETHVDNYQEKSELYKELKGHTKKMMKVQKKYVRNRFGYQKLISKFNNQIDCESNLDKPECQKLFGLVDDDDEENEELKVKPSNEVINNLYRLKLTHVVNNRLNEIQNCYQDELDNGTKIESTTLDAYIKLTGKGIVYHIGYSYDLNRAVITCVSNVIRSINFPAHPVSKNITLKQAFNFNLSEKSNEFI